MERTVHALWNKLEMVEKKESVDSQSLKGAILPKGSVASVWVPKPQGPKPPIGTMRRVGSFSSSEEQGLGKMVIALAAEEARRLVRGPQQKHEKPQQSEGMHTVPKWGQL